MHKNISQYLFVALGSTICAVAINAFLVPHHLLSGGISGIAMIFLFLFNWPMGIQNFIFNIPLMIAAYNLLGKNFIVSTFLGLAVFSVALDATGFLASMQIIDDIMLACIFGGVFSGLGGGMVFKVGGSTGGMDIVAAIARKFYGIPAGSLNFNVNCLLMLIAAFLFGLKPAMYTLISMYVSATVMDKVVDGLNRKKTAFIISDHPDKIAAAILSEIGRGVTFLDGEGAFTRNEKHIIFVVLSLTQVAKVKLLIKDIDPYAFMIVQDAAEVMGRGFTLPLSELRKGFKSEQKNTASTLLDK